MYTRIDEALRGRNRCATSIFTSGKNATSLYTSITDTIGILNGLIVTSPMHTILTIMRENIPCEDSLQICDELARLYHITVEDLIRFLNTRSSCHDYQLLLYKLSLINPLSENGGESHARALMIKEGFEAPTLQVSIPNPLYDPHLPREESHRRHNTKTMRPDFLWLLDSKGKICHDTLTTPLPEGYHCIIAEMDGFDKYRNDVMLSRSNARDSKDKWYQEKDRDVALQALGYTVLHFSYDDVIENNGRRVRELLELAGIPHISAEEQKLRAYLNKKFSDTSLLITHTPKKPPTYDLWD
ncbi:hypothetical protein B9G54_05010 [Alloscardovia macacae]|uniref:DUF559 domain-containing protein n=2 Tax=Alloscardovia macacae TaxID=1160091 RepID=A0A1Y2SWW6_9BIFI|nr:hypothetical protein B9G54_05010 [Alloscardovia macacae]OTA28411.1 hypothetical protein B9T39_06905 [Alloscardovia macacae]